MFIVKSDKVYSPRINIDTHGRSNNLIFRISAMFHEIVLYPWLTT